MNREMRAQITAMAMHTIQERGYTRGPLRFFTPLPAFWDLMMLATKAREHSILEVGAGNGALWLEGIMQGFSVQCIDMTPTEGVSHVLIADATTFEYNPGLLVLCCRPDHSGWPADALEQALERGASFAYVGLRQNFYRDLSDERLDDIHYLSLCEVGEEGEVLLGWGPLFQDLAKQQAQTISESMEQ